MKKARTYDFDLMTSYISDALGMDLEYERCSNFIIDKSSVKTLLTATDISSQKS